MSSKIEFLFYYIQRIKQHIFEEYFLFKLKKKYPSFHFEHGVQIKSPERLTLGNNILIQKNTIIHCGGMKWSNYKGYVEIGDDSCISPNCIFYGAGGIKIGKNFDCGPGVMIFSSRTNYSAERRGKDIQHCFEEVLIGDDVTLFANVVVDIGVKIGDGAVIGATSLVLSDIPPNELWAGIPAKFIKKIR